MNPTQRDEKVLAEFRKKFPNEIYHMFIVNGRDSNGLIRGHGKGMKENVEDFLLQALHTNDREWESRVREIIEEMKNLKVNGTVQQKNGFYAACNEFLSRLFPKDV